MRYDNRMIAWELEGTALGRAYYGNALYVAKDMAECNGMEEQAVLDRYLTGRNNGTDHIKLQEIANRIRAALEGKAGLATVLGRVEFTELE